LLERLVELAPVARSELGVFRVVVPGRRVGRCCLVTGAAVAAGDRDRDEQDNDRPQDQR
jgi:hypothetical protein